MELKHQTGQLQRQRRALLRIAYGILALGMGLAILAALVGGAAARRSALSAVDDALLLRNIAASILLIGLIVVLIAQRLPELQQRWGGVREGWGGHTSTAVDRANPGQRRLAGLAVTFCLLWLMIQGFPAGARGVAVLVAATTVPAVVAVVSLYGTGSLRAFSLGCLFPMSANLIFVSVLAASAWLSMWRGSRLSRVLELLGQFYGAATFFVILAAVTGILCVGVRRLLVGHGSAERPLATSRHAPFTPSEATEPRPRSVDLGPQRH
jgi:hypothetical protein